LHFTLRGLSFLSRGHICEVVDTVLVVFAERSQPTEHDACCGGALTVLSWFLVLLSLPWSLCLCLKVSDAASYDEPHSQPRPGTER